MKFITTSWDDGYPSDARLADLLEKYNLKGTFYIPKTNTEYRVMDEQSIVDLSRRFEIGGHTIQHRRINTKNVSVFEKEISGCYSWLKDLLQTNPVSFCFPGGVYNSHAMQYAFEAGFKIVRTTELLQPSMRKNSLVIPTTLQVYNHSAFTYYKHLILRKKFNSLNLFVRSGSSSKLLHLVAYYLEHILKTGGCFHLWGHSWELDANNLWKPLESILKMLSNIDECNYISNGELASLKQ